MPPLPPSTKRTRFVRWGIGAVLLLLPIHLLILWSQTPDASALVTQAPGVTALMRRRAEARGLRAVAPPTRWVPLDDMPLLACAVVKAEDQRFFEHSGLDWKEIRNALIQALRTGRLRGASTITAQLGRNLHLSPDRTLDRKLREIFILHELEASLSKPRILELYLNVVEWGDGLYGASAAAQAHFGKPPALLDAFEATALASLLAAPRAPLRDRNLSRFHQSQGRVLTQLRRSRLISHVEFQEAREASYEVASQLGQSCDELSHAAARLSPRSPPAVSLDVQHACGMKHPP